MASPHFLNGESPVAGAIIAQKRTGKGPANAASAKGDPIK
jgi:hypothetical protein